MIATSRTKKRARARGTGPMTYLTTAINRRRFASAMGGLLLATALPGPAYAQPAPTRRKLVAFLSTSTPEASVQQVAAFLQALHGHGWTVGQQIDFVERYGR